jgi:2-oxoglutarate ferredoxin oxidoreductase subunit beta
MHDGSQLRLRKLHEDYDPTHKANAIKMLTEVHDKGEVLTGVFYVDTQKPDFTTLLNMVDEPLATLSQERTRPGREVLAEIMEAHA